LTGNNSKYPMGSQYDVTDGGVGDPSTWLNPTDVEFVFTSCAAFNCWVEPRCGVESVKQNKVTLSQSTGNSSCYHRLYYWAKGWGGLPEGKAPYSPTSIENVFDPLTFYSGSFYYDKAAATFTYLVRSRAGLSLTATALWV
jgi:hypothetical protein